MNLRLVAADVRRRLDWESNDLRLVTSAATVQGFKARIFISENSHLDPLPPGGEGVATGSDWQFGISFVFPCCLMVRRKCHTDSGIVRKCRKSSKDSPSPGGRGAG
jgi:hypothetical protein